MAATTFVPAWKRVGLQLKRPTNPVSSSSSSLGVGEEAPPLKRRKRHSHAVDSSENRDLHAFNGDRFASLVNDTVTPSAASKDQSRPLESKTTNHGQLNGDSSSLLPPENSSNQTSKDPASDLPRKEPSLASDTPAKLGKKKRVTFSPDAKKSDGPNEGVDTSALNEATLEDDPASRSARKRAKRAERNKGVNDRSDTTSAHPVERTPHHLEYLNNFHTNYANWKFNKNQQKNLLKHIFDVDAVPTSYDAAIVSYIAGLKGDAIRTKLREDAEKIISETEDVNEDLAPGNDIRSQSKDASLEVNGTEPDDKVSAGSSAGGARAIDRQTSFTRRSRAQTVIQALTQEQITKEDLQSNQIQPVESQAQAPKIGDDTEPDRSKRRRGTRGARGRKKRTTATTEDDSDNDD